MSISKIQFKEFMSGATEEQKTKMKKTFYDLKIQEAQDKKGLYNKWEILPVEVQDKIIDMKKELDKEYIYRMIDKYHLTHTSLQGFLFYEYKNENDEGLKRCPAINHHFSTFIWIIINKENWLDHYYSLKEGGRTYKTCIKHFNNITKNKSPSLEEFILHREKEKEEEKEERKKKKEKKQKAIDDERGELKMGDLVWAKNPDWQEDELWDDTNKYRQPIWENAYIITGETKTQYRVDRINWTKVEMTQIRQYVRHWWYGLPKDRSLWTRKKSKNLKKKDEITKLTCIDDNSPFDKDVYYSCMYTS